ncbi:MAG: hypothetical protein HY951_10395 [Bacteroidia bacterium]|nr:hypothetical protein [Bacteroidia bacterium]
MNNLKVFILRKVLIILIVIIPVLTNAHCGPNFKTFSLLAGGYYSSQTGYLNTFSFNFERGNSNKLFLPYYSIGINKSFIKNYNEYGLKFRMNLISIYSKLLFKKIGKHRIIPYLIVQNSLKQVENETINKNNYNVKIGYGITTNNYSMGRIRTVASIEVGYIIPNKTCNQKSEFFAEIKVGIGINTRKVYRRTNNQKQTL